ncbi:Hydroxymethylpyrimidine/phosphomethylpyrimidine kinase [compost metagenome]
MVSRIETIAAIAERLRQQSQPVVLDPVMVATSGDRLLHEDAIETLRRELLPLATIVTPNLPEAALLTGTPMATTEKEITRQADAILKAGAKAVLIKGGHGEGPQSTDYLFADGAMQALSVARVETKNDHGTGCTLAAAITAYLARGCELREAVGLAKEYLSGALDAGRGLAVGHGRGPVHHFYRWWR